MKLCEINLARDIVCPTERRQRVYWLMIIYLCAAIALLALTCGFSTRRILLGADFHRRAAAIQQKFCLNYPDSSEMLICADHLKISLLKDRQQADTIYQALPDKIYTVLPLMIALLNQSDGVVLHNLNFTQKTDYSEPTLNFSIRVPETFRGQPEFLHRWSDEPLLKQQFSAITPVTTSRGEAGDQKVLIMSYRAIFME